MWLALVVSDFKELAGRCRDDGAVKTVRWLLAGSCAIGFELANLVFGGRVGLVALGGLRLLVGGFGGLASNSRIWFWLAASRLGWCRRARPGWCGRS